MKVSVLTISKAANQQPEKFTEMANKTNNGRLTALATYFGLLHLYKTNQIYVKENRPTQNCFCFNWSINLFEKYWQKL